MDKYKPKTIESKWQKIWEKKGIYKDYGKTKKFYALNMFPYPSGAGLHVGHPKGYIATDVYSRFMLLQGYSVLHPMGWDAFGLPAENYAIQKKIHPKASVKKNIATFKKQLEKFGFTYDWDREINTTDPEYYKWTQWIFLKMFEKGLAYESDEPINWCPKCKTGLALEDLESGLCERCGTQVVQKKMRQWVLKMTAYADRLLYDLDKEKLEWEDSIIEQQRNWIGRSEGAEFELKIKNQKSGIKVYTTRLDTVFGMTYAMVAPEHPIISNLKSHISNYKDVEKYIIKAQNKTELERTELQKEKTGVELKGIKVINPFNNEEIPLFVADYVLGHYGTGAVMAVPAHDERDFEFAKKFNLPIRESVVPNRIDRKNPPVPGKKFVERKNVHAIVRNPKNNTFLCLRSKEFSWITFPMGGIEEGEDVVEAARREVKEETGYKNLKFIRILGGQVRAEYFAKHKNENRVAYTNGVLFDLAGEEKSEVDKKWMDAHEIMWIGENKMNYGTMVHAEMDDWAERLKNGDQAYVEDGIIIDSGQFTGLTSKQAREEMAKWLEKNKLGRKKVNYKMRDWVFSRQRYWGEPIPIVHCEQCGAVGVPEKEMPLKLPAVKSYQPTGTGEGPLAGIKSWINTKCPKCKGPAKRESNTMPQWAGSSWYYLRYIDPKNKKALIDKKKEKEWMPVDLYVGGAEHATRHLLYARFWHKFLFDIGVVSTKEPFKKLVHVGLINGEDGRKMSKRWGNVINPDNVIREFGADSIRLYEMFMGPFTQNIAWSTQGVVGVKRFLERIWKLKEKVVSNHIRVPNRKLETLLHKTIKKVTEDIENFRFNTAISAMMILANEMEKEDVLPAANYKLLVILLSPFAPHLAEELWQKLGTKKSILTEAWPKYDADLIREEKIKMVVQVNGKLRDIVEVNPDISEEETKKIALESEKIKSLLNGKPVKKIIFVKGRLMNIVI